MKKLLLAVAVSSMAAGSVNAATVYEKDGFTYKLNGDFQVQFRQATGFDERADVEYDDLELKNYVAYDLGNDMTAFGVWTSASKMRLKRMKTAAIWKRPL